MESRFTPNKGNSAARLYIGNLDEKVTPTILWELMLQAGPVENVNFPKDRVSQMHQGYGFVDFKTEDDVEYAIQIFNQIKLYGKPIRVNKASTKEDGVRRVTVGAELHVSGLDLSVNIKTLVNIFSHFGPLSSLPKVFFSTHSKNFKNCADGQMSIPETGKKAYATISFTDFNASDRALEALNGQFLGSRPITVSYALRKGGKKGERHGSDVQRRLATLGQKHNALVPTSLPSVLPTGFAQATLAGSGVASGLPRPPPLPTP